MSVPLDAIVDAMRMLADARSALGARLRRDALAESRLSAPMIDWALDTTLGALPGHLRALLAQPIATRSFVDDAALVLSGNVFTAPAEPLALHAAIGVRTRVKAASSDGSFARAWLDALAQTAPALRDRFSLHAFDRNDAERTAALLAGVDVVTAYGSDETMQALRRAAPTHAYFVDNGHGFGAILLDAASLEKKGDALARRAAVDVAAYDQRGCRSPQVIFVDAPEPDAFAFAQSLCRALDSLERKLPRGTLTDAELAGERRWRETMRAVGTLYEAPTASVAVLEPGMPISTPLHRNIIVTPLRDFATFEDFAREAGPHLTVLGLDGAIGDALFARIESMRPDRWATILDVGEMQTTLLDSTSLLYALSR